MTSSNLAKSYDSQNFQAFYTDADEIRLLMQELLGDVDGKKVLEPCAGEGAFLDGLIGKPSLIHAVDIDKNHIDLLDDKFGEKVIKVHADFIDLFISNTKTVTSTLSESGYDSIICNPPFGLRFSVEYRRQIKKKFPQFYVRESYGLFLYFGINLLSTGGRFVYIVPDTFFTSRNHMPLRQFLVDNTSITDIIQFRSKRFETVNFGYGNLCIIAGFKGKSISINSVRWSDSIKSNSSLKDDLINISENVPYAYFEDNISTAWIHPKIRRNIKFPKDSVLLGDIAECRTGIYTGNNQKYCAYNESCPPSRANGHPINWNQSVFKKLLTNHEKLFGLTGDCCYVPFIRGGHRKPFEVSQHALNWSKDAVDFYDNNKKARLQNHTFYFRKGLAIPMVTSGRLTASLMENSVFDQGVVGVFPHKEEYLSFLLIYINSDIVSKYKSLINSGANNSANYLKRIPVPRVSETLLDKANTIVEKAILIGWEETAEDRDALVNSLFIN